MRDAMLSFSGNYLLVAAIRPELPLVVRRTAEWLGCLIDRAICGPMVTAD